MSAHAPGTLPLIAGDQTDETRDRLIPLDLQLPLFRLHQVEIVQNLSFDVSDVSDFPIDVLSQFFGQLCHCRRRLIRLKHEWSCQYRSRCEVKDAGLRYTGTVDGCRVVDGNWLLTAALSLNKFSRMLELCESVKHQHV